MPATLASLSDIPPLFALAPAGAVAALVMAGAFSRAVMARSPGDAEQQRIAGAVRDGAMAYLRRQYRVVAMVFAALVLVLGLLSFGLGLQPTLSMVGVPVAGLLSGLCGWFGMRMATAASSRTAAAAKESLNGGLQVAFRAGSVMGLTVVGFALMDASFWFVLLNGFGAELGLTGDIRDFTTIMLSFAMGASTQALFARVGGGIYTKAADVGADLVGKVEAGIPEDDARNPATIADNVGDNVGDVAGMGADLYESYYGSILSTAALGAAAAFTIPGLGGGEAGRLAMLLAAAPLALAGVGILASIAGIFVVRTREGAGFAELLLALNRGIWTASGLIVVAAFAALFMLLGPNSVPPASLAAAGTSWWGLGLSIVCGLAAGLIIARATEYYTSYDHPPTRRIAEQALTGPATVIIAGIAEGMKSTWAALLTIIVAIMAAFVLAGGADNFLMGLYGVSIAAVGMLATLGITLATDAYGPIADNAGGNSEMSGQPSFVRERTDMLDSLGNTTAAIGKGFAIGSAALTALALFAAYEQVVQTQLTTQAQTFARGFDYSTAEFAAGATREAPHAISMGHGRFALVVPGADPWVDGALLADRGQLADPGVVDHIESGVVLAAGPVEQPGGAHDHEPAGPVDMAAVRRYEVAGEIEHDDHHDDFAMVLVSTRNGSIADVLAYYDVTLSNPRVLCGLLAGVLLAFLFCSMTMQAVGRAAYAMMNECRRQFGLMREALRSGGMPEADIADPGKWPKRIKSGSGELPDYATCVSISTAGAQREMVVPSILAISVPLAVGLVLDVPGVVGLLAGGMASGFAVAVFMANAGGAWDNAKKFVESFGKTSADMLLDDAATRDKLPESVRAPLLAKAQELRRQGRGSALVYGKGSDDHKATVTGDTVGDPFKDTSGPSLNILIKLISIVSVVFAGVTVKFGPIIGGWLGLS